MTVAHMGLLPVGARTGTSLVPSHVFPSSKSGCVRAGCTPGRVLQFPLKVCPLAILLCHLLFVLFLQLWAFLMNIWHPSHPHISLSSLYPSTDDCFSYSASIFRSQKRMSGNFC